MRVTSQIPVVVFSFSFNYINSLRQGQKVSVLVTINHDKPLVEKNIPISFSSPMVNRSFLHIYDNLFGDKHCSKAFSTENCFFRLFGNRNIFQPYNYADQLLNTYLILAQNPAIWFFAKKSV